MVMDIVNAQGQLIEAVLPRGVKSKDGRRPHQDYRAVVNGIF
jgi:transposase